MTWQHSFMQQKVVRHGAKGEKIQTVNVKNTFVKSEKCKSVTISDISLCDK
jgi:hypothetical protein